MAPKTVKADPVNAAKQAGEILRRAREAKGATIEQMAKTTRIRGVYLLAIEEGELSELPGATFIAGFIRIYATALGLPEAEIAQQFSSLINPANQGLGFAAPSSPRNRPSRFMVSGGLLLLIGAMVAYDNLSSPEWNGDLIGYLTDRIGKLTAASSPETAPPATPAGELPAVAPATGQQEAPDATAAGVAHQAGNDEPLEVPPADEPPAAGTEDDPPDTQEEDPAPPAPAAAAPASGAAPATPAPTLAPGGVVETTAPQPPPVGTPEVTATPAPAAGTEPATVAAATPAPANAVEDAPQEEPASPEGAATAPASLAPWQLYTESIDEQTAQSEWVVVSTSEELWLQVLDEGGNKVFGKLMKPGSSVLIPKSGKFSATIGNSTGIKIMVDGKSVPISGTKRVIKNYDISYATLTGLAR